MKGLYHLELWSHIKEFLILCKDKIDLEQELLQGSSFDKDNQLQHRE
jgi:hypothetical protein